MKQRIRIIGAAVLAVAWLGLSLVAWFKPAGDTSVAERRPLAQFPALKGDTLLDGTFLSDFEEYTLDQFPLRDNFRQVKALFHYNVLGQKDNNDIILYQDYAMQMNYPMSETSVEFALGKFNYLYENYLKDSGSAIFMAPVPDKSYYLPGDSGYLRMDYDKMLAMLDRGMPYAQQIDLMDCLTLDSYYRTDTHWKQESLLPVAQRICQSMGVTGPKEEDFTATALEKPFYGVYYGQAALPMAPDTLTILESDWLSACVVTNHENGKTSQVYDLTKLDSRDLYDVFLSGSVSLLTIENPNATTDRELIVFRDSFGSSIVPLLAQDYATVTVVDIRYLPSAYLGRYLDFHGQDVLFLYSTMVLNNSNTLK